MQRDLVMETASVSEARPTLFLNGRQVSDRSYKGLKRAIDAALGYRLE